MRRKCLLAHRFRFVLASIIVNPDWATHYVLATCTLHNLLVQDRHYNPPNMLDHEDKQYNVVKGTWRQDAALPDIPPLAGNRYSDNAKSMRNELCQYLNEGGYGEVPWQYSMI